MTAPNATSRFSDRASQYSLYRPEYPKELIAFLEQSIGLNQQFSIADVGSGTGLFSKLFLQAGYAVTSVEPNSEMRTKAEQTLASYPGFRSVNGTAEATTLDNHSIDLITVAQAFHWFRPPETRKEFERVLKPSGHILLVWNILQSDTPFLKAYTQLKDAYSEQMVHEHRDNLERITQIFTPHPVITHHFTHTQQLDAEGLKGHLLSFSTVPLEGHTKYPDMMAALHKLFEQHNKQGLIELMYKTKLYLIPLKRG